jgi:hypothetical protein
LSILKDFHMAFVAVGSATGTLLAMLRGHILLVMLVSAFFAVVVALCGILLGNSLGLSAVVGFGSVAAVQVSYTAWALALAQEQSENFIVQIQAAIGPQLRTEIEVPADLPPQMATLVLRLEAA